MFEIVDPTRAINKREGHESDEDGHKEVKNEGYSLFVVRNGKCSEYGMVSFNVTLQRSPYMASKIFILRDCVPCRVSCKKTSEKSQMKEVRRYSESRAGTR